FSHRPHGRPTSPFHAHKKGGFSRNNFSRGNKNKKQFGTGVYIDPSRFINKAIITEEVQHFVPEHQFTDFCVGEALKRNVTAKGYTTPTPIQDRTIPHVLKGQDVVGIANTGTGKTAAFLVPLIDKVVKNPAEQVLIIVPTRELALQIDQELKALTRGMKLFSVCVVGGASIMPQLKALRYKNNFVIGTPGRLKDLIERGNIKLADFGTLVLDEADRMLDMGFVNDMRFVARGMPKIRHTLFFSATITREVEGLIAEFLKEPVRISVKTGETSKNVEQDVVKTAGKHKLDILHELLNQKEFSKVLVFGRTKHGVEKLSKMLVDRGFKTESIHGNKSHGQRQRALKSFKDNQVQILVATDVAARGLDIADISHVINYDLPTTYDDYVHRIGRTGRGTKRGKALTFVE
ncbi:MAG: DEAD/DEAH box helicase, partial [Candidatus Adlerbacteria bacterium]|nr:DEAD/DEAH box helicase [Candidatus Adlerbacteria bacterium]